MKYSDIKNGMKVRVIEKRSGIHNVGVIGTVKDYGASASFRVVVGEGEQCNWYEADQVEEVKEEKKMKAIVKQIGTLTEEVRKPGVTYFLCHEMETRFMGKEIEVEEDKDYPGWFRQHREDGEDVDPKYWFWHKNWLDFSKKEEKKVNKTIEKLEKDIEATKKSLLKWKINTALLEDGTKEGVKYSASECPLCILYARGHGKERCAGCPIEERSGKSSCEGTPYEKFTALVSDDKLDEAARQSAQEVYYLTEILIDLRCRLAVEKARIDRPPYHKDFEFGPKYETTGVSQFVKLCIQSKRSLQHPNGETETVVIDEISECRDDDHSYADKVFYEISMVDGDDESDAITSFPTIKDAITYAGKFGCQVEDELNKELLRIREGK